MWWRGQHLSEPRKDPYGRKWHFLVWHGVIDGRSIERIFFWDEKRSETGVIEFAGARALHVTRLRQVLDKIVKQPEYRARYRRELEFPVERAYREYVPFS